MHTCMQPSEKDYLHSISFHVLLAKTELSQDRPRRIFVYTFCLINICLSLSYVANKIKTQNIERA